MKIHAEIIVDISELEVTEGYFHFYYEIKNFGETYTGVVSEDHNESVGDITDWLVNGAAVDMALMDTIIK